MTSPRALEAWKAVSNLLYREMEALREDSNEDDIWKKCKNVRDSFDLIDNEPPVNNPNKANARHYFLAVVEQSHELFVLSCLAAGRALFSTFAREPSYVSSMALSWFKEQLPPPRLRSLTQFFFAGKANPCETIVRRLFPTENTYFLARLSREQLISLLNTAPKETSAATDTNVR